MTSAGADSMDGVSPAELEEVVWQLLETPEARRTDMLRELAAANPPLAEAARRLILRDERSRGVLRTPPDEGTAPDDVAVDADPLVGRELGEFKLLRLIAVGGMGRVYEAEQRSPRRRVAVKVMASRF